MHRKRCSGEKVIFRKQLDVQVRVWMEKYDPVKARIRSGERGGGSYLMDKANAIEEVITISKRIQEIKDEQCIVIHKELAGFALLKSPFETISPVRFRKIHEANQDLFHKLTSTREKLKRKAEFRRISKKIGSLCLVISYTTFIISLLVLAFHSVIRMVAALGLAACFFGTMKMKKCRSWCNNQ
ncbi:Single hybrid motif superfamily protein isoform 1 [Hibiscus syriacus]|uniref:Single hybrid motif superfamily protein isoform 1 n=1 Tax=Hibiscus syriacus TaxID=106335 RepID=A0A6A3D306_HIBSY|nr:Single hybrid motif superfamily protein isoform 1 [Hibiscus syriacus]